MAKANFIFICPLALGYLSSRLPHKYCHPHAVSHPSSGWIGVVPPWQEHQKKPVSFGFTKGKAEGDRSSDPSARSKPRSNLKDRIGLIVGQTRLVY